MIVIRGTVEPGFLLSQVGIYASQRFSEAIGEVGIHPPLSASLVGWMSSGDDRLRLFA